MSDKPIAVAEYPIRYDGKVLHVPANDVAAVQFSLSRSVERDESTGEARGGDYTLTLEVTFKPGVQPRWQTEG